MKRTVGILVAAGALFAAAPSFAQTVGTCPRGGGSSQPQPVRILFDLNSSHLRQAEKPAIAQAVKTAKDRQVSAVCLIGHTDKLGDKAYNLKLARARAQTRCRRSRRERALPRDPRRYGPSFGRLAAAASASSPWPPCSVATVPLTSPSVDGGGAAAGAVAGALVGAAASCAADVPAAAWVGTPLAPAVDPAPAVDSKSAAGPALSAAACLRVCSAAVRSKRA